MTSLQTAATALLEQWGSPRMNECMLGLRKAIADEQAQAVEPVATVQCINGVTIGYLDVIQPVGTKLFTHPAPPAEAQQVAVPMTDDEILNLQYLDGGFDLIKFARAVEAHHGIGAKPC